MKWRRTRLATDLIHLKEQQHLVCQMLDSAKAPFYHDKSAACRQDSKSLFRLMDNILGRGAFSNFFNNKVSKFARAWM